MKVCFIGACGHVDQALSTLRSREDVEIVGIAAESEHENIQKIEQKGIPVYDDFRLMLDKESPNLAVVSPVFGHTGSVIVECAKRGINIFSEKPVASSLRELDFVEQEVKRSGVRFCAMHYLRFDPAFYTAARIARSGVLGDIRMITAQKSYKFGTRPQWYADRTLYGGTIPWVGIHAIDWIYHFTGKKFLSVNAQSFGDSPEMAATCQFEMEDGILALMNIDYYRPSGATTHGDDRVRCACTKGVIEVRGGKIYLIDEKGAREIPCDNAPDLLSEFLSGREPISAEEIFYLTRVALLARDSADLKRSFEIRG